MGRQFDINLTDADLMGTSIEDIKCRGCNGPLCDEKTPKIYRDELVFVCHLGEAGQAVLARAAARNRR